MNKIHWTKLMIALILPHCAGLIGSIFTRESVAIWYQGLVKPAFSFPGWIFAPVWISLYFMIGKFLLAVDFLPFEGLALPVKRDGRFR